MNNLKKGLKNTVHFWASVFGINNNKGPNIYANLNDENKSKNKILFICKKKHLYSESTYSSIPSGLFNSANFVVQMLNENGIESKFVEVNDNNNIDFEVKTFNPTHVIIEALWVVPSKFEILQKLHPNVKWIIRLHSEIPFLSNEGIAIEWIYEYQKYKNVILSGNSERCCESLSKLLNSEVVLLPNYYPVKLSPSKNFSEKSKHIDIGCFGAIRPLKNQLIQAIAAVEFGNTINKDIHFHINSTRIEGKGDSILKNLDNLFKNNPRHTLIKHEWMSHDDFIKIVKNMDIGLQVSFSETFNIVTADLVNNDIPVIVSSEISWVSPIFYAETNSTESIVSKLNLVWNKKSQALHRINKMRLNSFVSNSKKLWLTYFKK